VEWASSSIMQYGISNAPILGECTGLYGWNKALFGQKKKTPQVFSLRGVNVNWLPDCCLIVVLLLHCYSANYQRLTEVA